MEGAAAVGAGMERHLPHGQGAALHHVPDQVGDGPLVGRLLGVDEGVEGDTPQPEGVEDLGPVPRHHVVDVEPLDLGHRGDEVLAGVDAGDDQDVLAAGLGGAGGDVRGQVGPREVADMEGPVGGRRRDGDDRDAGAAGFGAAGFGAAGFGAAGLKH